MISDSDPNLLLIMVALIYVAMHARSPTGMHGDGSWMRHVWMSGYVDPTRRVG